MQRQIVKFKSEVFSSEELLKHIAISTNNTMRCQSFEQLNEGSARRPTQSYKLAKGAFDIMIMRMAHRGCNVLNPLMQ